MGRFAISVCLPLLAGLILAGRAGGDGKSKAATEVANYVIQRFGRTAAKGGVGALAARIETTAARHGPDVFQAVRQVGPRAIPLVEQAGANGSQAARVLARHGEAGIVSVVTRPAAMKLVARHGDRAATAMVKHAGGVAEPLIGKVGAPAIHAFEAIGPRSGRQLAMLAADGHLTRIGRTTEVLEVIAKYGDRAATFVWNNKGALATATVLAAFLANPEPFLNGTRDLAQVAGKSVVAVTKVAGEHVVAPVVGGIFTALNVVLGVIAVLLVAATALMWKYGVPRPEAVKAAIRQK
jgi:hypothetical protein